VRYPQLEIAIHHESHIAQITQVPQQTVTNLVRVESRQRKQDQIINWKDPQESPDVKPTKHKPSSLAPTGDSLPGSQQNSGDQKPAQHKKETHSDPTQRRAFEQRWKVMIKDHR
jgi:hypothetical protein